MRQEEGLGLLLKVNHETQTVDILDERAFSYSGTWDNLVYDIDELLFAIENAHSVEIKKAAFFVYSHLVDKKTGELKDSYMTVLKNVIKENNIESLGYIEMDEILARMYSSYEKMPLNAVIIELDVPSVSASVYQGGQKKLSKTTARTKDLVEDLESMFAKTKKKMLLPPRIIMYDSTDLQGESHAILTHPWSQEHFVQIPKVDVVKEHELKQALVLGSKEEIFGTTRLSAIAPTDDYTGSDADELSDEADADIDQDETNTAEDETGTATAAGAAGASGAAAAGAAAAGAAAAGSGGASMGFVVGKDVTEADEDTRVQSGADIQEEEPDNEEYAIETAYKKTSSSEDRKEAGSDSDSGAPKSKFSLPFSLTMPSLSGPKNIRQLYPAFLVLGALVLIAAGIFASMYFFHKAELIVQYSSEPIEEDMTFTEELDVQEFSETFSIEAEVPASGTSEIGEKAKGNVTIFNADDEEQSFSKGTEFTTPDGLTFTLDNDVTIDAASSEITDEGDILTSTSKADASLTAAEIGTDYNVRKDTEFTISDFSKTTYFARAKEAFKGGTQEEVQTVSADDLEKLEELIEKRISEKSKEKLTEISSENNIIEDLTTIDRTKETYSAELAEEADAVTAKITADVTFYSFDDAKLKEAAADALKEDVPENYMLSPEDITYEITDADIDEDSEEISVEADITAVPKLDIDTRKLLQAVKGLPPNELRKVLKEDFKVNSYEAKVYTQLPFLKSRLPFFSQNITVDLKAAGQ